MGARKRTFAANEFKPSLAQNWRKYPLFILA